MYTNYDVFYAVICRKESIVAKLKTPEVWQAAFFNTLR